MRYRLLFCMGLALFCACQKQEFDLPGNDDYGIPSSGEKKEIIISATLADTAPETRTELERVVVNGVTTNHIYWLPGDQIAIFSAGEESVFTSQNTERALKAFFKGQISVISGGEGEETSYTWGIYPYRDNLEYREPNGNSSTAQILTYVPTIQSGKAGSFADDLAITLGRSKSLEYTFKSAYSGLMLMFKSNDIVSATLKGNNNESLAGKFWIGMDSSLVPEVKEVVEGQKEITLYAPDGKTFETEKYYYFITMPGVRVPQGYSVTVRKKDGTEGTFSLNADRTFARNNFLGISGYVDQRVSSWHASTTQGPNEIWYTTTDNSAVAYVVPSDSNTGNEVDEIIAPSDNNGVGIIRFKAVITEIDHDVFFNNGEDGQKLTSVSFPDCVERIGNSAFDSCENLSEVHLGTGLKEIGEWAFSYTNLTEIDLPDGLEYIGNSAFNAAKLTSVHIPESVLHLAKMSGYSLDVIGGNPFWECENLRSFTGKFATDDGRALIETASDGKKVLVSFATAGMDDATYTVPKVDRIGIWAFYGCTLGQVILPVGLRIISDAAFSNCKKLTSLDIPASVNEICGMAFGGCSNLQFIKIRSSAIPSLVTSAPFRYYNLGAFSGSTCNIYVPANRLKYYKNGEHWDVYEDRIVGYVPFSDPAFESYMLDSRNGFNIDGDGFLTTDEAEQVETIVYWGDDKYNNGIDGTTVSGWTGYYQAGSTSPKYYCYGEISSFNGIEYLTNLKVFDCSRCNSSLKSLNLYYNTQLTSLSLVSCDVSNLNLSHNTALRGIHLGYLYKINSLDLRQNVNLTSIQIYYLLNLGYLNLPKTSTLTSLYCTNNKLQSLYLSPYTNLTQLNCNDNKLTSLDLGSNTELKSLYCYGNQIEYLDVSTITSLNTLVCNPMTVDGSNVLQTISIREGQPTSNWDVPEGTEYQIVSYN